MGLLSTFKATCLVLVNLDLNSRGLRLRLGHVLGCHRTRYTSLLKSLRLILKADITFNYH